MGEHYETQLQVHITLDTFHS